MAIQQRSTVVGVFEDRTNADRAVSELRKAGFRDDQIGVAMRHSDASDETATTPVDYSEAGSGALTGALAGMGLGALAGLGVLAGVIPVVGPAIAGGTLGVILSNAAAGAGIAGLAGALIGHGVPEEEANYYHGEFEAGRVIVTVKADGRYDDAAVILRRAGAYDMSTRGAATGTASTATTSHASGAATEAASARAASTGVSGTQSTARAGETMQVKEERLHAEKRPVEAGEVHVRKEVHTENKTIDVPVEREEVFIERKPVHGRAAGDIAAGDIREGEDIRIPVREERVDVSKEAVVTEEVNVGKRVVQDTERVSGQVRKEQVRVDKEGDVDVHTRGTGKGPKP
jgi:uncharacterized protein (TIGR02271 family)